MAILNTPNGTVIGMIPEELLTGTPLEAPVTPKKRTRKKAETEAAPEAVEEKPEE